MLLLLAGRTSSPIGSGPSQPYSSTAGSRSVRSFVLPSPGEPQWGLLEPSPPTAFLSANRKRSLISFAIWQRKRMGRDVGLTEEGIPAAPLSPNSNQCTQEAVHECVMLSWQSG